MNRVCVFSFFLFRLSDLGECFLHTGGGGCSMGIYSCASSSPSSSLFLLSGRVCGVEGFFFLSFFVEIGVGDCGVCMLVLLLWRWTWLDEAFFWTLRCLHAGLCPLGDGLTLTTKRLGDARLGFIRQRWNEMRCEHQTTAIMTSS